MKKKRELLSRLKAGINRIIKCTSRVHYPLHRKTERNRNKTQQKGAEKEV